MHKKIFTWFLALCMLFAFTACGSQQKPQQEESSVTITPNTLTVGTCAQAAPFSYLDEKGNPTGFSIDVAAAIAGQLDFRIQVMEMEEAALAEALKNKEIDMIAAPLSDSKELRDYALVTSVYYSSSDVVIIKSGADIISPSDIDGKKVAVIKSTDAEEFIKENCQSAELLAFDTAKNACEAVNSGQVDAAVLEQSDALSAIAQFDELTTLLEPLSETNYVFAVQRDRHILCDAVSAAISALKTQKDDVGVTKYSRLFEKYWPEALDH